MPKSRTTTRDDALMGHSTYPADASYVTVTAYPSVYMLSGSLIATRGTVTGKMLRKACNYPSLAHTLRSDGTEPSVP